jgi:LysR family transcriptional regulator, hydrogen peroxide-inducible genes activator
MTLTQLSYIVAVDDHRHFATAAEKIYVTQPTLSMQIHKLEEQLGVKIFDRSKTPVTPTHIGEQIIKEARQILKQAKLIEDIARTSDGELKGKFRIGVIPTIAPYLIPLFLHSFVEKYPDVELIFEEMLTRDVLQGLSDDTLDVGIIATATDQSFIYEEGLFNEPFVGYLSLDHPLVAKSKLTLDDLDSQSIWLLNEGHCLRDQTMKLCKKENKNSKKPIQFESGNLETLKKLVEKNFGMTLMPCMAIRDFDNTCSNAVIKEFSDPIPSRKVRLVYGRKYLKQNMIIALKDVILENLPDELRLEEELMVID